jgi:flagellar FliL protein
VAVRIRDEQQGEARKEKKKKPWLTIVLVFLVLLLGSGYGYLYFQGTAVKVPVPTQEKATRPAEVRKLTLEPFVVNLADPGLRRYLRVKITLEYLSPYMEEELNQKLHRIRDTIIAVLRSKKTEDLAQEDALKRELLAKINAELDTGQVKAIYFEEFIIQ